MSSLYRLEDGFGIRLVNVRKVFDVINREHGGKLDFSTEVEEISQG